MPLRWCILQFFMTKEEKFQKSLYKDPPANGVYTHVTQQYPLSCKKGQLPSTFLWGTTSSAFQVPRPPPVRPAAPLQDTTCPPLACPLPGPTQASAAQSSGGQGCPTVHHSMLPL
jgi:hypothetical protein